VAALLNYTSQGLGPSYEMLISAVTPVTLLNFTSNFNRAVARTEDASFYENLKFLRNNF